MWQLIVSAIIETLIPILTKMLEQWLNGDLKTAADRLAAKQADPLFDPPVDALFDEVLSMYSPWNPANWYRRYQLNTIKRALYSSNNQFVLAAAAATQTPGKVEAVKLPRRAIDMLKSVA